MVVILVKKSDAEQFMYETNCKEPNDKLIRELVKIWNMRLKLELLAGSIEQLAQYGPAKPEAQKGLDEIQDEAQEREGGSRPDRGPYYKPDPTGNRTGEAPAPQLQEVLKKVAKDARLCISADQVNAKVPLTVELLQEKIDTIRGAVTIAYPMGLPKYDPIREALDDLNHVSDMYGPSQLNPEEAQLWWAGKEFHRDETVGDRVGKNEKTRVVAKLQNPKSGPPGREPGVTEAERKAMMAYYFKKQEEMKRLAENDADDYLNSTWADSKALKSALNGTSNIRFR